MILQETVLGQLLDIFKNEGIEKYTDANLIERLGMPEEEYKAIFSDRQEMVQQVVQYDLDQQEDRDQERLQQARNPVEKIFMLLRYGIQDLKTIHPDYISDLRTHYPKVWQTCLEHLNNYNYDLNYEVINEGVVQGYFRKDINLQLVAKIIIEQFHMLINPQVFPPGRYDLGEVFRSMYLYYVRGLCTEKGGKLAEEYFSRNNI